MIKRLLSIVCVALLAGGLYAQEPTERIQRTPEEEALQQTMRLVRELAINDSVRFDTIYRMHLKYARIRQKGLSRAENMERMHLLTPEEFEQFMNHPAELPRRPRGANVLTPYKQVPQEERQPANRQ